MGLISRVSSRTYRNFIQKMVTFVCGKCGESLKKQKVENHTYKCSCPYVSCIDCSIDFYENDYTNHIKCITEQEKYGGDKYRNTSNSKGEQKQSSWTVKIQEKLRDPSAIAQISGSSLKVLNFIQNYENIPRKKKKFGNFVKNTCKWASLSNIDEIWEVLEDKKEMVAEMPRKLVENIENTGNTVNTENIENIEDHENPKNPENPFKWKRAIKRTLRNNENSLKIKKLRKTCNEIAKLQNISEISKQDFIIKVK